MHVLMYLQAQHIDTDFYDELFAPGLTCLPMPHTRPAGTASSRSSSRRPAIHRRLPGGGRGAVHWQVWHTRARDAC
ncbi:hypothetical protein I553_10313 [Mycobacterium xenopi 4042]|uniref:Uncharacterized protein n=1 Tax=Mycobacterium xenopi 4042 TaxID=1299334 RepID=X7ZKC3_MYCXE|nr:hypothetical protein I553_10313 [Mycobacterium xenopi 4042]